MARMGKPVLASRAHGNPLQIVSTRSDKTKAAPNADATRKAGDLGGKGPTAGEILAGNPPI
ncbi:hypothetical protein JANAI62_20290 [Jannaschia pagri]|uniref:Uncharacterized protein n=2 Tax=Roseobacteraceae TaxID=2854170 RepID=A0ABQ4NLW8_9RHOB|nr:hypothetical protein JANAI61_20300 [Jannaschia sp. AI_61]GIT95406.1 hypothetical protein JANAI62_20290 [Jannaschia sp. AI_62]